MTPAWVRLTLDVDAFDDRVFADVRQRCSREGIVLTTMAELGDPRCQPSSAVRIEPDVFSGHPGTGRVLHVRAVPRERIERDYTASTTVIALDDGTWVGMSAASDHRDDGYFFNEMTGVIRSHRGRGIALAMKVTLIDLVRELGVPEIRTFHHPDNEAPISLNRKLGYVDAEAVRPPP